VIRRGRRLPRWLGLLILLSSLLRAAPAAAHGGIVWVDDNYGPYHVVVQTTPGLAERQVRFTIVVSEPDSGAAIADAQVQLHAVLSDTIGGPAPIDLTVPPEAGQPGFYDMPVDMPSYGNWQVSVAVRRAGATGTAVFALPLQPPPDAGSPLWWLALLPVLLGVLIFLYYWRVPAKPPDDDDALAE